MELHIACIKGLRINMKVIPGLTLVVAPDRQVTFNFTFVKKIFLIPKKYVHNLDSYNYQYYANSFHIIRL